MPNLTAEQIAERSTFIGGSEAPAVLGCSPFDRPYDVFLRKIGQGVPVVQKEEMEAGHWFEDTIATWYEHRTGRLVWVNDRTYTHTLYPFIGCHVDRFQGPVTNAEVVEVKFTSKPVVYDSYLIQLQHNMLVTGCQKGTIVVQGGPKQIHKDIEADPDLHTSMIKIYTLFWKAVELKQWEVFSGTKL